MYNFFVDNDWLDRSGPFPFNFEHLFFVFIMILVGIVISLWLSKKSIEFARKTIFILWIITVVMDLSKWCANWYVWSVEGKLDKLNIILPLYTCSFFVYIMPVALFAKNEKIQIAAKNFISTLMLPFGFVSLFLALGNTRNCSMFSFFGFHTVFYHGMMYVTSLPMLVSGLYKPKKKDLINGLILFSSILLIMLIFDNVFKVDYMYIYDGSTLAVFSFLINALPHRIVWTVIIVTFYYFVAIASHFIILFVRNKLVKFKEIC